MKEVVELLKLNNKTIATMESCTGGAIVNAVTNVEGSSDVIKFSAITYNDDFKMKLGVSADIISKYSVYSKEVANEMSKEICNYTLADYGVGITGRLNNINDESNRVYISIYDSNNNVYYNEFFIASEIDRLKNKERIVELVILVLKMILNSK